MKFNFLIFSKILMLLMTSCNAQTENNISDNIKNIKRPLSSNDSVEIRNGNIISMYGYDISKYGDYELYDLYIDDLSDLSKEILLGVLVENCDLEATKSLLNEGVNPNTFIDVDHILTEVAFCENALEITKIFVDKGADINGSDAENSSFLSYAIMNDNIDLVEYILNNGGDENQKMEEESIGCYPIHSIESVDMLNYCIKKRLKIDLRCSDGRTLLHEAAKSDNKILYNYILENKLIDPNTKDENGMRAIDYLK